MVDRFRVLLTSYPHECFFTFSKNMSEEELRIALGTTSFDYSPLTNIFKVNITYEQLVSFLWYRLPGFVQHSDETALTLQKVHTMSRTCRLVIKKDDYLLLLEGLCNMNDSLASLALGQAYSYAIRISHLLYFLNYQKHQRTDCGGLKMLHILGLYPEIDQPLLQSVQEFATEPERLRISKTLLVLFSMLLVQAKIC
jgi:hypothetical protein